MSFGGTEPIARSNVRVSPTRSSYCSATLVASARVSSARVVARFVAVVARDEIEGDERRDERRDDDDCDAGAQAPHSSGRRSTRPERAATTTASNFVRECSLVRMFRTWFRTVCRLRKSPLPISSVEAPSASIANTSRFARGEVGTESRLVGRAQCARQQVSGEHRGAACDRADGARELVDVAILRHEAAAARVECGGHDTGVVGAGEQQHRGLGFGRSDLPRCVGALSVRESVVHDHHVGLELAEAEHAVFDSAGNADDLEIGLFGQRGLEPASDHRVVLDE